MKTHRLPTSGPVFETDLFCVTEDYNGTIENGKTSRSVHFLSPNEKRDFVH